ncbi:formamidopyrimidine-DNA glycosylase [Geosmithia morbida]|uniref:Formamidopyrimidine-DNA glycosylase n=1 Tax=Geosmithia morbida TaxID=1094350 RepID=A0A9P4Z1E9_9HYPO|nr:formamidopyrimidine-DNA glycosylase [Geosmithia morbida]KAF4125647.1 formamidopyrimidine-DNA glycosylase [Geosmithia morbida]
MPEIAEVARIVHFLRLRLVGKRIASATAIDDANVFGKAGTTSADVEKALEGRTVVSAGNQGKYFWITLDKPPHVVMHFGMTGEITSSRKPPVNDAGVDRHVPGWVHIRGDKTAYTNYYKKMKESELDQWPPRFWKFQVVTEGVPETEIAFTDPRRFGRVRLVHCPGESIRQYSPLVENGPDPVVDTDSFTIEYMRGKMRARRVPIKALLLDQTVISGIGNWVADETLYHAKLHPEQYCDEFDDEAITKLFESIRYVCQTAVDKLGDSDEFPEHWLFNHRWDKARKGNSSKLPNGEKLAFITVGGRTSCYAPAVQKKSSGIAARVKTTENADSDDSSSKTHKRKKTSSSRVKKEESDDDDTGGDAKKMRKQSEMKSSKAKLEDEKGTTPRRRSGRLQK